MHNGLIKIMSWVIVILFIRIEQISNNFNSQLVIIGIPIRPLTNQILSKE